MTIPTNYGPLWIHSDQKSPNIYIYIYIYMCILLNIIYTPNNSPYIALITILTVCVSSGGHVCDMPKTAPSGCDPWTLSSSLRLGHSTTSSAFLHVGSVKAPMGEGYIGYTYIYREREREREIPESVDQTLKVFIWVPFRESSESGRV